MALGARHLAQKDQKSFKTLVIFLILQQQLIRWLITEKLRKRDKTMVMGSKKSKETVRLKQLSASFKLLLLLN